MEQEIKVEETATMEQPKKKRVRRTAAELLKESRDNTKRLKAKAKVEAAAKAAKIDKQLHIVIKKQLGRELEPEDVTRLAVFIRDQDDRGDFFKTAMERDF